MCAIINEKEGSELFTISFPYYYAALLFAVPPGEPYTSLEKIFFPFKGTVWLCICILFIAAVILVIFLKFVRSSKRQFIFGPKNDSPLLNMINIFLGGAIIRLPRRNFARTLLLIWMSMSLILKSAYQGRLYHFIRTDQRSYALDDLAKIAKTNYTIYATPKFYNLIVQNLPNIESQ